MTTPNQLRPRLDALLKRCFDVSASAIGLVVFTPVLALIALGIKASSRGPILFQQTRIGKDFQPFSIYKFRTMVVDAEKNGRQITAGGDARITGFGQLLRKSKLDELPQLFNVIKGDMSMVGPRPEVERYVLQFKDEYREILRVRPGITDLASLEFRNESDLLAASDDPELAYVGTILPRKIAITKKYLADESLLLDMKIIFKTVASIFTGRAY